MAKRNRFFLLSAVVALIVVFSFGQAAAAGCLDRCAAFSGTTLFEYVFSAIWATCVQGSGEGSFYTSGGQVKDCGDIFDDNFKIKLEALLDYDYCANKCKVLDP